VQFAPTGSDFRGGTVSREHGRSVKPEQAARRRQDEAVCPVGGKVRVRETSGGARHQ